jgi:hypothetical protein
VHVADFLPEVQPLLAGGWRMGYSAILLGHVCRVTGFTKNSLWSLQSNFLVFEFLNFCPLCNFVNFGFFFVKNSCTDLPLFLQNTKSTRG